MSPTLGLVAIEAALIAVRAQAGADCPSAAQLGQAIESRMPGVLVPGDPPPSPDVLRLILLSEQAAAAHGFTLVDGQGRVRLRRSLPPPAQPQDRDCPALAESVALIVERYLQGAVDARVAGVGAAAATAPPEPAVAATFSRTSHRWEAFAGTAWRAGTTGLAAYDLRVGIARALRGGRFSLGTAIGAEGAAIHVWRGGSGRLQRFPFELRGLWRAAAGPALVEAGPSLGIELLALETTSGDATRNSLKVTPVAGLTAGARLPIGGRGFVRLVTAFGVALLRYEFVTPAPGEDIVAFDTPRAYGKLCLEAGVSFW